MDNAKRMMLKQIDVWCEVLAGIALGLGVFGLVHHRIVSGLWWQWRDVLTLPTLTYPFWHHEPLIVLCFLVAFVLLAWSGPLHRKVM